MRLNDFNWNETSRNNCLRNKISIVIMYLNKNYFVRIILFIFFLQNLIRFRFLVLSGASYLHKFCYSSVIGNRPIAVLPGVYTSTQPTVRKSVFRDIEDPFLCVGHNRKACLPVIKVTRFSSSYFKRTDTYIYDWIRLKIFYHN